MKRAAAYGKKAVIIEGKAYGGTCVNVGCVPKKIMFNAALVSEVLREASNFGFDAVSPKFHWKALKDSRDTYIKRLNGIYERGLDNAGVKRIEGWGSIKGAGTVAVTRDDGSEQVIAADHIVVAVGGRPRHLDVVGEELVSNSDDFFSMEEQPRKAAIIGAGYIAVELAGVLNALGTDTSLLVRGNHALRSFDTTIAQHLDQCMKHDGVNIVSGASIERVERGTDGNTLTVVLKNGQMLGGFDKVFAATGRVPVTGDMGLEDVGAEVNGTTGYVTVDEFQNTTAPGVYALGDCCGRVELTPMAIAAGRHLSDRLFGSRPDAKADYDGVPTVVFSHPTIGTVGLTQAEAETQLGAENVIVYASTFVNLWYGTWFGGNAGNKPLTKYKLVCRKSDDKVLGLHMIGMGSDEVLQGFGVALKMGATKADFDSCIAIHPTAAEEMVTLPPMYGVRV